MLESALALQASVPQAPAAVEASCSMESGKQSGKPSCNGKQRVSRFTAKVTNYCTRLVLQGLGFRNHA